MSWFHGPLLLSQGGTVFTGSSAISALATVTATHTVIRSRSALFNTRLSMVTVATGQKSRAANIGASLGVVASGQAARTRSATIAAAASLASISSAKRGAAATLAAGLSLVTVPGSYLQASASINAYLVNSFTAVVRHVTWTTLSSSLALSSGAGRLRPADELAAAGLSFGAEAGGLRTASAALQSGLQLTPVGERHADQSASFAGSSGAQASSVVIRSATSQISSSAAIASQSVRTAVADCLMQPLLAFVATAERFGVRSAQLGCASTLSPSAQRHGLRSSYISAKSTVGVIGRRTRSASASLQLKSYTYASRSRLRDGVTIGPVYLTMNVVAGASRNGYASLSSTATIVASWTARGSLIASLGVFASAIRAKYASAIISSKLGVYSYANGLRQSSSLLTIAAVVHSNPTGVRPGTSNLAVAPGVTASAARVSIVSTTLTAWSTLAALIAVRSSTTFASNATQSASAYAVRGRPAIIDAQSSLACQFNLHRSAVASIGSTLLTDTNAASDRDASSTIAAASTMRAGWGTDMEEVKIEIWAIPVGIQLRSPNVNVGLT